MANHLRESRPSSRAGFRDYLLGTDVARLRDEAYTELALLVVEALSRVCGPLAVTDGESDPVIVTPGCDALDLATRL